MIKFLEWLGGYFACIAGVDLNRTGKNGKPIKYSLNFIDGYAHRYEQCEIDAGIYGFI